MYPTRWVHAPGPRRGAHDRRGVTTRLVWLIYRSRRKFRPPHKILSHPHTGAAARCLARACMQRLPERLQRCPALICGRQYLQHVLLRPHNRCIILLGSTCATTQRSIYTGQPLKKHRLPPWAAYRSRHRLQLISLRFRVQSHGCHRQRRVQAILLHRRSREKTAWFCCIFHGLCLAPARATVP